MDTSKETQKWTADFEIDKDIDSEAMQQSKIARCYFLLGRYPKSATRDQIRDFEGNVTLWKTQKDDGENNQANVDEIASYFFRVGELPKNADNGSVIQFLISVILPINKKLYDQLALDYLGW